MEKLPHKSKVKKPSLGLRLISAAILIPLAVGAVLMGGWWLTAFIAIFSALAGWELGKLFALGGYHPWVLFIPPACAGLIVFREAGGLAGSAALLGILTLVAMAFHTIRFEQGIKTSGSDFLITTGGFFYIGWMAAFIISLRALEGGQYWTLLVLVAIAFADGGAYFIGSSIGKHKMMPKVSPHKSWEGYLGGIPIGTVITVLFAAWFHTYTPIITWQKGLVLGLVIGTICPLGDFGESMLKRQFEQKDSSQLIPGHGGFLDRIDSYLWAAIIGYYFILWFLI
jgi:phosphatidate cytidylyltransferase